MVALPYALGFVVWRSVRARERFLKPVLIIAGCALLVMSPWMAKNWIFVRNPFSPFLNSIFPNPYIQVGFEKELGQHISPFGGTKAGDCCWPRRSLAAHISRMSARVF